jgi:perosamine synthetase
MGKLAITGGEKVRKEVFPAYSTIGEEEQSAVKRVLDSKVLSKYLGAWHEDFYGGPEVQSLEQEWSSFFNVKHAISVNSATSGLYCAVGASGVGPGDEVIVSPYTMSASAAAIMVFNAIPVFADVEPEYFCLDPQSVEKCITKNTKAIMVVDIMGQPYDVEGIRRIAKKYNLVVIEDCAQAPGAKSGDLYAGTLGDIGVFSLNYHKHIQSGEGGIVVTQDDRLADRIRLIRNHAEAVVDAKGESDIVNMIGFNFRMNEIEAAISREQLKKLPNLIEDRIRNVEYLNTKLTGIPCLSPAPVRKNTTHVYYVHPLLFDENKSEGISRNRFIDAVKAELMPTAGREAEGVMIGCGYVKPLYLQPIYQKRIAYGKDGCPWSCDKYSGTVNYEKGLCPVTENLNENSFIAHEIMRPPMTNSDLNDVADAFHKVWDNRKELL